MNPQDSARLGGCAELLGLRVSKLNVRNGAAAFSEEPLSLSVATTPRYLLDDGFLIYTFEFDVRVNAGRRQAWKLQVTYEVAFRVPPDFNPSDDECKAFGETTAIRVVYPYLRQLTNSLSLDFALPPALLGLLRVKLPAPAIG